MKCEYTCAKMIFDSNKVKMAQIFFTNGDYFEINSKEIVDIAVSFYDQLHMGERGFCPVAKAGAIKCKISHKKKIGRDCLLYQNDEYDKDIKEYLEKRCVNEGGIRYIRLFDENSWHLGIYCFVVARLQDEFLVLEFQEQNAYGTADSNFHTVRARDLTKNAVERINLDFENCDGIEIFQEEIQDIQIHFEDELCWTSSCFGRQVQGGFIRLKFKREITWRNATVDCGTKENTVRNLKKRLCGKGRDEIDICHLYVTYQYAGYGLKQEECIRVNNIRSIKEQNRHDDTYISGYAQKEKDGSILIVFGK